MDTSHVPSTPRQGVKLPAGHILVNHRWKGTDLVTALQGMLRIVYDEHLGVVDFHPASDVGVMYLAEGDLAGGSLYRRKLVKLRKADTVRGVVIAEKTSVTDQYFSSLQKFTVIELGLVLVPVASQADAATLLAQMVQVENHPQSNKFRLRCKRPQIDGTVKSVVQMIPKLGDIKAQALLEKFRSISAICNASVEELSTVVGRSLAVQIKSFLSERVT